MRSQGCERENVVVAALRDDAWSDELRAHALACPACSEVLLVSGLLFEDARAAEAGVPLPDPGKIWLEAKLRARRLALARATRPITVVQRIALACGVAVAAGVGVWLAPHIGQWLGRLRPPSADIVSSVAFVNGLLLIVVSGGFLALAAYAVITSLRES